MVVEDVEVAVVEAVDLVDVAAVEAADFKG